MLIQLELENFIFKEIFEIQAKEDQDQTQADVGQIDLDIQDANSKLFQAPSEGFTFQQINIVHIYQFLSKNIKKLNSICLDTFASDKIVRLVGSVLKILKNFNILKKTKFLDKSYMELIQLRRLLRANRLLSYFKQIIPLLKKSEKKWLDYYNIIFKNFQFILDTNDSIGYLQQLNVISKERFKAVDIRKRTSNMYFIQCLMWLFLNTQDYFKNKNKRNSAQNFRKQLAILKYALDSFTSYNDFSRRLYTIDPKITTIIGAFSSIVGLYALWV